jgi:hypothetical protein
VQVPDHRKSDDEDGARRNQYRLADGRRDGTGERRQGERPNPRERSARPGALAALALDADQQPAAERDGEAEEGIVADRQAAGGVPAPSPSSSILR